MKHHQREKKMCSPINLNEARLCDSLWVQQINNHCAQLQPRPSDFFPKHGQYSKCLYASSSHVCTIKWNMCMRTWTALSTMCIHMPSQPRWQTLWSSPTAPTLPGQWSRRSIHSNPSGTSFLALTSVTRSWSRPFGLSEGCITLMALCSSARLGSEHARTQSNFKHSLFHMSCWWVSLDWVPYVQCTSTVLNFTCVDQQQSTDGRNKLHMSLGLETIS